MEFSPASYIPIDRRHAIARGTSLPDRARGAVLFADISGFTFLTEALSEELGPHRGAEELSKHLNRIYTELIRHVHTYSGSVISFSGDAITCWFNDDPGFQAAVCAMAMQGSMHRFATISTPSGAVYPLAIKVAVAAGSVRRFRIGNPQIQYLDALAGATLDRLASAEHHANRGEVVLSAEVAQVLGSKLAISEWRSGPNPGESFAIVANLDFTFPEAAWPDLAPNALSGEHVKPWILPATYDRVISGQEVFQSELRPVVALFLSFRGIDYDGDPTAGEKLDAYIRWIQAESAAYDGSLVQITFGDKGSYIYIVFGAPNAHEDDVDRAALTALRLRTVPDSLSYIQEVKIGISKGRMRVGPYGGHTRITYGVLGDHANLAARLMQNASSGQVLVSSAAKKDALSEFKWEECEPLEVKGKTDPITVYLLKEFLSGRSLHLQEAQGLYPIVGRETELNEIESKLELASSNRGQIVAITAEAGLGKSRLVSEIIRKAAEHGFEIYVGECQSYGTNISYHVWWTIWQAFFGLKPEDPTAEQIKTLELHLKEIGPAYIPRLPLLGSALNLPIPENQLVQSMDAKLRKDSLESLLVDILRNRSQLGPQMLVLEDCHWLDPLSNDLLVAIGRVITNLPVMIVCAYRPLELEREKTFELVNLPYCTTLPLNDFTPAEARQLITLKLSRLENESKELPASLIERITQRAQGNPFYIEELVNYLHDLHLDVHDPASLQKLDLPSSLQSLILSRIDTLRERQKIILKVASIIGRLFKFTWLWGVDPELGDPKAVAIDLDDLSCLDLTPLDQPEPVSSYLFKHIITWEVAYESQPYTTRSFLHGQVGNFIENSSDIEIDQYTDLLAYHYSLGPDIQKKREYLRRAGEAAQANFANTAAIDYYQRLLSILDDPELPAILFRLGQVYELVGNWQEARRSFETALEIEERLNTRQVRVDCLVALGSLMRKQGKYADAGIWLDRARLDYEEASDPAGISKVLAEIGEIMRLQGDYNSAQVCFQDSLVKIDLIEEHGARLTAQAGVLKNLGTLANQQGNPERARQLYEQALENLRQMDDRMGIAILLNNLGMVAMFQEDYAAAQPLFEESLVILRDIGYRWAVGQLLNNLGLVMRYHGDAISARQMLEESVEIRRALGDKWGIANSLSSLSNLLIHEGEFDSVRELLEESLRINSDLGDRIAIAYCIEDFASLAAGTGEYTRALRLAGAMDSLRKEIGSPLPSGEQAALHRTLEPARQALSETSQASAWEAGQTMTLEEVLAYTLSD